MNDFLNSLIAKGPKDKDNKLVFAGLTALLGAEALSEDNDQGLLSYNEGGIPTGITEKGTIHVLLQLGHLQLLVK